ncbi:MAG: hypothetical protein GYA55_03210 [SAR324 cluster bacterium]|uniref:Uncharacterized protein n=1 Tax=SAR324 cluster bacterium TaxID=2024889 RepID=A0A7X9IJ09_9DELT|nr:hypothetical protein [SAR324 cluster bacterium]
MLKHSFQEVETEYIDDYFERVNYRMSIASKIGNYLVSISYLANLADNHIRRFDLAAKRFLRAMKLHDKMSQAFERVLMFITLYEAIDHLCIVLNLLDFEKLDLESSLDGHGLSGDSAAEVVHLLNSVDEKARKIIRLEEENHIIADFYEAFDEKQGLTYTTLSHWQDFVAGSIQQSFRDYFKSARQAVHYRLEQKPRFWKNQSIRQYLHRKNYKALLRVIGDLEGAKL